MPRPYRFRALAPDGVEIEKPTANRHHAVSAAGLTHVIGTAGDNVVMVWLKVLRISDPIPPDPSVEAGWVSHDTSGQKWFIVDNVQGAQTTMLTGNNDNKLVAIPQLADLTYAAADVVYVIARPPQEMYRVEARHCIWFTFAPSGGLTGPDPQNDTEPDINPCRPSVFYVPVNATSMSVTASDDDWSHFGAVGGPDTSDADGMAPMTALEREGYRSPKFLSEAIPDFTTWVNKLIGMWIDIDDVPIDAPFAIGTAANAPKPDGARKIVFAMHDGKRWHNNFGHQDITIDWVVPESFFTVRRIPGDK